MRYWLASLQLEEALSTRPRARRSQAGSAVPRLDSPMAGQEYFKIAIDTALERLVSDGAALSKPFDAELAGFFETWLANQYRRGNDDTEPTHLLSFPVVHLPRGELAGLLRCGVRVRFGEPKGETFEVPSRAQRRRHEYPPPPSEVRLRATESGARQWPFFVDTRLLNQQLGVARESIDALFDTLRAEPEVDARGMLALVCRLLERELGTGSTAEGETPARTMKDATASTSRPAHANGREKDPTAAGSAHERSRRSDRETEADLIARITRAMDQLLQQRASRARVYPVAIVLDGSRARATFYLQREIQSLLQAPSAVWDPSACLGAYLRGASAAPGYGLQRGLFAGPSPTPSQRSAAEAFLGSRFTAVQGPPGTGKTTLILHLAAHALVQQTAALTRTGGMGDALFVVTSTNNRAVDNVVDPLLELSAQGLPLALRAGNRLVCEQVLAPLLARTRTFLVNAQQRTAQERALELSTAVRHFAERERVVGEMLAPRERALQLQTRASALRTEIAKLSGADDASTPRRDELAHLDEDQLERLRAAIQPLHQRLTRLCQLTEEVPKLGNLQTVDRHQRSTQRKQLPAFETAMAAVGLNLELGLPPALPPSTDPAVLMEVWQEAAHGALDSLEQLLASVAAAQDQFRTRRRVQQLQTELDGVLAQPLPEPDAGPPDDAPHRELLQAAVALREAWAASHCVDLLETVDRALATAREDGSLRPLFNDARHWKRLRQLFPVWGCTLLSLGNSVPAEPDAITQLVIDEAGQCHPAYALSGLLRTRSVLVIGDVHQLEPVIDLEIDDDDRLVQSCRLTLPTPRLAPYRIHAQAQCSVQRLADRAAAQRLSLRDHFRCQPDIIAICDRLCQYGLQVHTPQQGPAATLPFCPEPVSWVDIQGTQERDGGSWYNPTELEVTLELIQSLLAAGLPPEELAVITPYRGQLDRLRRSCRQLKIALDASVELQELDDDPGMPQRGVGLGTVHRFQGGERSVVLFSTVVSERSSLPFLDRHPNLLNVAISRARHRLITLGNRALLATGRRTALLANAAHPLEREQFRSQLGLQL